MKILFDFRAYQIYAQRGIGRYLLSLLQNIINNPEIDITLLISNQLLFSIPEKVKNKTTVYILEELKSDELKQDFDFYLKGDFMDVAFQTSLGVLPEILVRKCKKIVGIVYDLIPLIYYGNYHTDLIRYTYACSCIQAANGVFAISECTKNDLVKYLNIDKDKIVTIYGGVDTTKFKTSPKGYCFHERSNIIVSIVGDDLRKNYVRTAKAFAKAYRENKIPQDSKLYFICKNSDSFINNLRNAIKEYKLELGKQIIATGYISDDELLNLLWQAKGSIFPSLYEGLGLPVLESYTTGTPCFASNVSSTQELVIDECAFNPRSLEEISQAIVNILTNEELCKKNLDYGKKILEFCNWDTAARKLIETLYLWSEEPPKKKKVAIFSPLPPEKTGIAPYTLKTVINSQDKFDVISDITNIGILEDYISRKIYNVIPYKSYYLADKYCNYASKIFVLGNSEHHLTSLNEAIRTMGEKQRFVYLHESALYFLFFAMFKHDLDKIKLFLKEWYPLFAEEIDKIKSLESLYELVKYHRIFCVKPLLALTGINNIIVNNEYAKKLIEEEIGNTINLNIKVLFHPIPKFTPIDSEPSIKTSAKFIIGSFGISDDTKMTAEIIQAVDKLAAKGISIKLLLAGYQVSGYLKSKGIRSKNIIIKHSPSDEELFKLMQSIDLAVQLRKNPHGESSGCIAQLLGLNKKILTTENFVDNKFKDFVYTLPSDADTEDLEKKILFCLQEPDKLNNLYEEYSYEKLAELLYNETIAGEYLLN